jgi:hypothetical protein
MKKGRFTKAQIMGILCQAEGVLLIAELCWEHEIGAA